MSPAPIVMCIWSIILGIEQVWRDLARSTSSTFKHRSKRRRAQRCQQKPLQQDRPYNLSRNRNRPRPRRMRQTGHPPVYCIEDLQMPPPTYQSLDWRTSAPSGNELSACRNRLATLEQQDRQLRSMPRDTAYETSVVDAEITTLRHWIDGLERDGERLPESRDDHIARGRDALIGAFQPSHQHAVAWERFGKPREVRPQLLGDSSSLVLEADRWRFEALRAQKEEQKKRVKQRRWNDAHSSIVW